MPLQRLLNHPRIIYIALFIGIALSLPNLRQGFLLDDVMILSSIEEWFPEHTNAFDIYSSLSEELQLPWWTAPGVSISFFRVLPSALLRLDHLLFGRWAVGYYLDSLLWLGLLLVLVSRLYQHIFPRLAPLALLIFALDECHGVTAGWISNRHAMIAVTFGLAGLLAHLRWREEGWSPGLPLSVAGFALALLSGETGVTLLAYAGAYELLAGPGPGRRRWVGLVPPALVGITYVLWYKTIEYGFKGAGFYIDPSQQPLEFLRAAVARIPALLGNALIGVPPDLWWEPRMRPYLVVLGLLAILALGTVIRLGWSAIDLAERRHLVWIAAAGVFSSIPLVAAFPATRQLLAPMLSLAVVLAAFVEALWRHASSGGWRRVVAGSLAIVFLFIHLIAAPAQRLLLQRNFTQLHQSMLQTLEKVPDWNPDLGYRQVIALNVPDTFTLLYGPALLNFARGARREHWIVLTAAPHEHRLLRTGTRSIELAVLDGEMLATAFETGWPPEEELQAGTILERGYLRAEIVEKGEVGPTRLRFEFPMSLDRPDLLILRWGKEGFEKISMPPVGESLHLQGPQSSKRQKTE